MRECDKVALQDCAAERDIAEHDPLQTGYAIKFGPFRLLPAQKLLLRGDEKVAVGARALDILVTLVRHAGEVVSKADLIARVWPDTFVEESNLRVHVAGLRRALNDDQRGSRYIVNVPGRGYAFVAPIQMQDAPGASSEPASSPERPSSLPSVLTRVVGRADVVGALSAQLSQRRFITLVGPGGIGKTTVAVTVAQELSPSYRDGVSFVDLASISGPQLVPNALAAVLRLAVPSEDALPAVIAFLKHKHMLLVLDSCEHVVEAAANAAEEVASGAPGVHILATSREPLRAAGERVHRLPPLENPSTSEGLTADQAMTFPGIQLFVERAAASLGDFDLSDPDAPIAADICRRLDGIALAIELAAGRVAALGLRGLSARLDDRFRVLTGGRRTALPRHQTLAATLDWSYDLLPELGRKLLRRLTVFAGGFTLDAAVALFEDPDKSDALNELADLVSKSLVVADLNAGIVRYRLLDTTRLYGFEKLKQANEFRQARRAHAQYFRDYFGSAEADAETLAQSEWLVTYGQELDNVRAALEWAGSSDGDPGICVALTIAAVPLWVQLSLMGECRGRVERALEMLKGEAAAARSRMQLCAALGWSLMYAAGRAGDTGAAWAAALEIAEMLGDTSYRLRALWGVWVGHVNRGDFRTALDLAQQLVRLVADSTDEIDLMMADRLLATTLHYRGDQGEANRHIGRMLSRYATIGHHPRVARFQIDQKVTAHYFQARILWLRGFADQAKHLVERNMEEGLTLGHALSFCSVLGQGACPIALFTGDLAAARRCGTMLLDHSEKHALGLWRDWASCFNGLVMIHDGDMEAGLHTMRAAFDQAGDNKLLPRYLVLLGEFAACLGRAGKGVLGLATIDGILSRCERSEERWYVPEALRVKGELILLGGAADAGAAAEDHFAQAIELARWQEARSWELRSAMSLARLRRDQGRPAEAYTQLSETLAMFSEGFETRDLQAAQQMLTGAK